MYFMYNVAYMEEVLALADFTETYIFRDVYLRPGGDARTGSVQKF
jgi:hypothetical protein